MSFLCDEMRWDVMGCDLLLKKLILNLWVLNCFFIVSLM